MNQATFGESEVRPVRTMLADLVYDQMADGASEVDAIGAVRDEVFSAIQEGTAEPWMETAALAALRDFVRAACRDRERRSGPTVVIDGKRGKLRSVYAVPAVVLGIDEDVTDTPAVQLRLKIFAMAFQDARLALANQERLAANHGVRIDRLRQLINYLQTQAPHAATLGEAAAQLGCTQDLIELSDVMDALQGAS